VGIESDEQELSRIKREVIEAAPGIMFEALGFPKQDLLISALRNSMPGASFLGVGTSLSYATGDLTGPPAWIWNLGLEWAYRLWWEPTRRLARRLSH
jgi:N-acetylglucosaminyldiphosphoundecaprenol N-acetyl-beta-D-mannosaminyltransferase